MVFVEPLNGMVIGAVDPVIITADTPIDYTQWPDGKPGHIRREGAPQCSHD